MAGYDRRWAIAITAAGDKDYPAQEIQARAGWLSTNVRSDSVYPAACALNIGCGCTTVYRIVIVVYGLHLLQDGGYKIDEFTDVPFERMPYDKPDQSMLWTFKLTFPNRRY